MGKIVTIRRIGGSLGIILPKSLVDERGLRERDKVEIDPKPMRDFRAMAGMLRGLGLPSAEELNRMTNEGEEL